MNFSEVKVLDPHSDVSLALLDRVVTELPLKECCKFSDDVVFMYPDAGAAKKYKSDTNAIIGNNTIIEANTSVGDNATIGADCILYNNVTIYHDCKVGNRCILHAGSVVGADGFGFAPGANGYEKIPQIGIAILEDDVEIGANTCIDRATMGATIIKRGVKLDNMVQVAHNVVIDEHTVMASQCGVAGSTKVGSWCMVGGQAGISGHIKIGNQVKVGGHSGVTNSVQDGKAVMGYPAFEHTQFARATVIFKKLPEMYREMDTLKKEIESLKQQLAKGKA